MYLKFLSASKRFCLPCARFLLEISADSGTLMGKGRAVGAVSESHGIDGLAKSYAERQRMQSLRRCIEQLNSRPRRTLEGKRICHPVMVWSVSPAQRKVTPASNQLTYACELAPTAMTYLVNRMNDDTFAVVEFLDAAGAVQARFLVKILETQTAIRGLYAVNAKILARVADEPESAVFPDSYFHD